MSNVKLTSEDPGTLANIFTSVGNLLDRSNSLTDIVRTAWIMLMITCLYVWVTLASLKDIDFFLPERTVHLPIIGSEVDVGGFFLFAPALLVVAFVYFHLMLARLWECYGQILIACEQNDDDKLILSVDQNVAPWFLTVLIPHRNHGFDTISRLVAVVLAWGIGPATLLALMHRYLTTNQLSTSLYHGFLFALSLAMVVTSIFHRAKALHGRQLNGEGGSLLANRFLLVLLLTTGATWIVVYAVHGTGQWATNAMLYRAELSSKPSGWNEYRWQEINTLVDKLSSELDLPNQGLEAPFYPLDPSRKTIFYDDAQQVGEKIRELETLKAELSLRQSLIIGVELGILPSRDYTEGGMSAEDRCDSIPSVVPARTLNAAYMVEAYMVNANLKCTSLKNADLRYAILQGADLEHAKMTESSLNEVDLRDAILNHAIVEDSDLQGAQLQNAELMSIKLSNSKLNGANMQKAVLSDGRLEGAEMKGVKAQGANFSHADLRDVTLNDAKLFGADFTGATLEGADLESAELSNANFSSTSLSRANLKNADLRVALLWGVDFSGVISLEGTRLNGAAFKNVDLTSTAVSALQLSTSFGDASVTLPEGINYPPHWSEESIGFDQLTYAEDPTEFYNAWHRWLLESCGWTHEPPYPMGVDLNRLLQPMEVDVGPEGCSLVSEQGTVVVVNSND